jgi:hypothetical protein
MVAQASAPAVAREKKRTPISPLTAAPTAGRRGMSQMYFIDDLRLGDFRFGEIRFIDG